MQPEETLVSRDKCHCLQITIYLEDPSIIRNIRNTEGKFSKSAKQNSLRLLVQTMEMMPSLSPQDISKGICSLQVHLHPQGNAK